jgi:hypothetical protein
MSRLPVMLLLALAWVIIVLFTAGCTAPAPVTESAPAEIVTVTGTTLPVTTVDIPRTPATTVTIPNWEGVPEIHVDGYWTYPQGRDRTGNPVALIVHTEAFNTGTQDAREVRTSGNFYYGGRMICHDTIYLGTLAKGGYVSRDTMVFCTLPSPFTDTDLEVRFENTVVFE